jgi:hypothetical protein
MYLHIADIAWTGSQANPFVVSWVPNSEGYYVRVLWTPAFAGLTMEVPGMTMSLVRHKSGTQAKSKGN